MKTNLRLALCFVSFLVGAGAANAADSVRVQASTHLRVAVVDASKRDATRSSVHEAFAASLSASLQRQLGGPVGVRMIEQADITKAAADLDAGACDAALVFEATLPIEMRTAGFSVMRGVSEVGVPVRIFHLVVNKGDPSLVNLLTSAFNDTLKAARFQEALTRSVAIKVVASNTL
jgi:hypothetical protein